MPENVRRYTQNPGTGGLTLTDRQRYLQKYSFQLSALNVDQFLLAMPRVSCLLVINTFVSVVSPFATSWHKSRIPLLNNARRDHDGFVSS